MRQHQLDSLILVGIIGVGRKPPESGLTQGQLLELPVAVQPPRARVPSEVVAAVVRDDDLLTEAIVAVGVSSLTLAAPHPDQRQQREHRRIEVRAFTQVRGIGGDGKVLKGGEIPAH
ncbi:Uncharacterised protein [Mycobacteroides abscessus subsp. abscessus]|nr:Uncharacterised protein [Mycobacteroides abscessus subsp. abscessus]